MKMALLRCSPTRTVRLSGACGRPRRRDNRKEEVTTNEEGRPRRGWKRRGSQVAHQHEVGSVGGGTPSAVGIGDVERGVSLAPTGTLVIAQRQRRHQRRPWPLSIVIVADHSSRVFLVFLLVCVP